MRVLSTAVIGLVVLLTTALTKADFGDYEDLTFQCPAYTTCPIVCVATAADCPPSLSCPVGESLCLDGSCAADCTEANDAFDPEDTACPSQCLNQLCPKIDNDMDSCQLAYGSFYEAMADHECPEDEPALWKLREPGFLVCYIYVASTTLAMLLWCFFNQVVFPVSSSTLPLLPEKDPSTNRLSDHHEENVDVNKWTQTGYNNGISLRNLTNLFNRLEASVSLFGFFLYLCMVATIIGLQVVLIILTVYYYVQQELITSVPMIFEDEIQVLRVFEITWGVAFILTFALKWPHSVSSLFLRRSVLEHATHVAVFTPSLETRSGDGESSRRIVIFKKFLYSLYVCFNSTLRFIFSDVNTPLNGEMHFCPVKEENGVRYFIFRLRRYNYDGKEGKFVPGSFSAGNVLGDFLEGKEGLNDKQVFERRAIVGSNGIEMKRPNIFRTIAAEFMKPFYTYQLFMVWTWYPLWYYYMAFVQTIIITSGGLIVSWFNFRNECNIYRITRSEGTLKVKRNGVVVTIAQQNIVPGDIIHLDPGTAFADMVIIQSKNIICDESALTGESTPVSKTAIDRAESSSTYTYHAHKKHTISAGTTIIEASEGDLAMVIKTGSYTAKGELLRDILAFKRCSFKFDTEVKIVMLILLCYAIITFSITVALYKDEFVYEWFYGMFVVGTALPPLLPTVFTVSVGISDKRLQNKRIVVTNNESILVAGKVKMAFFDKTGTLTKQGLDFLCAATDPTPSMIFEGAPSEISGGLKLGMATCHSLALSSGGLLVGNQVDRRMFEQTNAQIVNTAIDQSVQIMLDGKTYTVLKRFDFDHHRMTMSVVVKDEAGELKVFVKGSGESIQKLCQSSTIPKGFEKTLQECARQGIYQISIAARVYAKGVKLDIANLKRDDIEKDLSFVGVINFKNVIRDETASVMQQLYEGDVLPVMVTGDNVLTGICISRECGLIRNQPVILGKSVDEKGNITWVNDDDTVVVAPTVSSLRDNGEVVAVTGKVWNCLSQRSHADAMALAKYIKVYGRCTPNDKSDIVGAFVDTGVVCCMVGDGGNDCGALKTAHVGIALSDAEASTVSPFTSLDKCITSVVEVLKEGRCALASAFASYKYMIMYGQVETINQLANAYFSVTFSEWCWVFMDGIWMVTMAFSLPLARAAKKLSSARPTSSLLGPRTMASALGVLFFNFIFTCIALGALKHSDWYKCRAWGSTDISNVTTIGDNYEAATLFVVTGYQYISSAMAFNFGFTHRAAWWNNYVFVLLALGYSIIHLIVTLVPSPLSCLWRVNCSNDNVVRAVTDTEPSAIINPYNTTVFPVGFRWSLVAIMVCNTIVIMSWEYFVVNLYGSKIASKFQQIRNPNAAVTEDLDAAEKIERIA